MLRARQFDIEQEKYAKASVSWNKKHLKSLDLQTFLESGPKNAYTLANQAPLELKLGEQMRMLLLDCHPQMLCKPNWATCK